MYTTDMIYRAVRNFA